MLFRIFRNSEGADSTGTEAAAEATTHTQGEGEGAAGSESTTTTTTQAKPEGTPVNRGRLLADVLKKQDKNKGYQPSEAEWEVLDEHFAGNLQPDEGGEGEPDEKLVETDDEGAQTDDKEKGAPKGAISELMSELGAKDEADVLTKVRELKKFTGSRDAQAYAKLERSHGDLMRDSKAERQLWEDVKKGVPRAIEYLESKVTAARKQFNLPAKPAAGGQGGAGGGTKPYIDPEKFTFQDEAKAINEALAAQFGGMQETIAQLTDDLRKLQGRDQQRDQEHFMSQAASAQLDETMSVAALIPELKSVKGLRDKVAEWIRDPKKEFPELKVLDQLFDVATKNQTNLRIAWDSIEAERLRARVARAKDEGREEAYSHKPNPSLSDVQGRGGNQQYKNYTDAELKAMSTNWRLIPDGWLTNDELDPKKMPARARELLLPDEG